MLVTFAAGPQEGIKLLLLVAIGGGLLALGRWSSRRGETRHSSFPANLPSPDPKDLMGGAVSSPKRWPPSAEEVAASLPFDPLLGKIQIRKLYFDKTDITPGPQNPEVFAEELHIELYNPDSGHSWWQSYFVATPQGLETILREKHWRYLHAPEILVFPRYDLEEIRRAVVGRIAADLDYSRDNGQPEEETL